MITDRRNNMIHWAIGAKCNNVTFGVHRSFSVLVDLMWFIMPPFITSSVSVVVEARSRDETQRGIWTIHQS